MDKYVKATVDDLNQSKRFGKIKIGMPLKKLLKIYMRKKYLIMINVD